MIQRIKPSTPAIAAIAAVLALSSTQALAQDAAAPAVAAPPAAAAPPVASPPAPAPVAPAATAPATAAPQPVVTSAPVVQAVPATAPSAEAPVAAPPAAAVAKPARPASRPVAARASAAAPTAASTPLEPAAAEQPPAELAPLTNAPAVAAESDVTTPAPVAEALPAEDREDYSSAIGLGLLGAFAGFGLLALRRGRKPGDNQRDRIEITPVTPSPEPEAVRPKVISTPTGVPAAFSRTVVPATRAGAARLPDGAVPTGEAREALLKQMVAAAPDAANPFTSHKARRRRARIILQAHEHKLRNQTPTAEQPASRANSAPAYA